MASLRGTSHGGSSGMPAAPRIFFALILILASLVMAGCAEKQSGGTLPPYKDPAPHSSGFVTVAPGVRLNYLDFGGHGVPIIMLAGAGDSAHVFDTFAPLFTDGYRVIALTRRGFGESSRPKGGYDTATLAADILAAIDELGFKQAIVIGHSLAGAEMTRFAVAHPGRVRALVYLDAAYDWATKDTNEYAPPVPPSPTAAQLASPQGFAAFTAFINGVSEFPLAEIRATNVFASDGSYVKSATPAGIAAAVAKGAAAEHPDYAALRVPTLAVYTVPDEPKDMFPWLAEDSAQRATANAYFPGAQASLRAAREAFAAADPEARVVEMQGTPHFLFLAQPKSVARGINVFLGSLTP